MQEIIIPDDIVCQSRILDITFSPTNDVICIGDMHGNISLYNYANLQTPQKIFSLKAHDDTTRNVKFNDQGNLLFSTSSDGSVTVTDLNAQRVFIKNAKAHNGEIFALDVSGNIFTTGDENGRIKIWDMRQRKCVSQHQKHHDFISQLLINRDTLYCAGGDGCMSTWNLKTNNVIGISDNMNTDLLSIAIAKEDERLVCGGQDGKLYVWNWNDWEYPVHKLKGHPESIEAIIPVSKNRIITGSSDGIIRLAQIDPHQLISCIGAHDEGFSIERLALSRDKNILASSSHSRHVKFWDVGGIFNDNDDEIVMEKPAEDIINAYQEEQLKNEYNRKRKTKGPQTRNEQNPFYADM